MSILAQAQYDPNASAAVVAGFAIFFAIFALIGVVMCIGCGYWAAKIMRRKGRSGGAGWGLGLVLGIVGVIIAACLSIDPVGLQAQQQGVV